MEFVESRIPGHDNDCRQRPGEARISPSRSDRSENEQTQHKVLDEMRRLANVVMNDEQSRVRSFWQDPMQSRNDDCRGAFLGKRPG